MQSYAGWFNATANRSAGCSNGRIDCNCTSARSNRRAAIKASISVISRRATFFHRILAHSGISRSGAKSPSRRNDSAASVPDSATTHLMAMLASMTSVNARLVLRAATARPAYDADPRSTRATRRLDPQMTAPSLRRVFAGEFPGLPPQLNGRAAPRDASAGRSVRRRDSERLNCPRVTAITASSDIRPYQKV